ncbi:hypothetical protein Bra471DRAFT_04309 [Bradyrhizobium sp. WSM471]|nr:hypothetical protein Bra471DRAFT_04309 [Bradyrhizobium sp. WSM471]
MHLPLRGPRLCGAPQGRCAASGARAQNRSSYFKPRSSRSFAFSRPARPEFRCSHRPQNAEGAGKAGCRLAPTVHCAKVALQEAAQRHTGEAQHTAFPAQWFDGLCRDLPGERCTIAPVALRMADARTRSGRHITATLGAQTPGARTTRFCRTQAAPVVCATPSLTVSRPAKPFAPTPPAPTTSHPAFVTIAIRPSAGLGWPFYMIIRITDKEKYFCVP